MERLKKEKQLQQLEAQYREYASAANSLGQQASELGNVKSALYARMQALTGAIGPLRRQEKTDMRASINAAPGSENESSGSGEGAPYGGDKFDVMMRNALAGRNEV